MLQSSAATDTMLLVVSKLVAVTVIAPKNLIYYLESSYHALMYVKKGAGSRAHRNAARGIPPG